MSEDKMLQVKKWFEDNLEEYSSCNHGNTLVIHTKDIIFSVVSPHSGTNNRWMLRISTIAAFDRWVNSTCIEEFFYSEYELLEYLIIHKIDIYEKLLRYLSEEYFELEKYIVF